MGEYSGCTEGLDKEETRLCTGPSVYNLKFSAALFRILGINPEYRQSNCTGVVPVLDG